MKMALSIVSHAFSVFFFASGILICAGLSEQIKETRAIGPDPAALLVNTTYGVVQGFSDDVIGVQVSKFFGVPYAGPPVGPLRFMPPIEPTVWPGVRDATKFGSACLQVLFPAPGLPDVGPTSEDCLYLNVYTLDTQPQNLLPVMVWIHGGAFMIGSGGQYNASLLASRGVVMVTINYRLGAFGFLSTGDDAAPGNYAMLDQIMALKWVQKNIRSFGGDPSKVTIFGQSAGSASVSLLTISPLAKGLFQNAIMESGSSLSSWAIEQPALRFNARTLSRLIASQVGCDVWSGTSAMVECLRQVDSNVLLNATITTATVLDAGLIMLPRVETAFGFLPDLPINLLHQGKFNPVNTIRGFNSGENAPYLSLLQDFMKDPNVVITENDFKATATNEFRMFALLDLEDLVNLMADKYVGNERDSQVILRRTLDAYNDLSFGSPTIIEYNLFAKAAPSNKHYLYEFAKRSNLFPMFPDWIGATHGEEIAFLFGWVFNLPAYQPVSVLMIDLWTNFAMTNVPTSLLLPGNEVWREFSQDLSTKYLLINDTSRMLPYDTPYKIDIYNEVLKNLATANIPPTPILG